VDNIVVTRGADGVVLVGRTGLPVQLAGRSSQARNAVGAGDSLVAALALGLATGASLGDSVRLGMESAAIAVTKPHTAAVSFAELSESLGTAGWDPETLPRATISAQTEILLCQARSAGKRLVLTNGIFDLLHEGHVSLLRRARCLGDLLVVALNTDESVRGLKGEGRPINNVEERRALLEALGCVDQVIVFDGPSAASVVRAVRPDVYVKGDDHEIERLPEAVLARQLGARLVSMPRVHAVSTTQIIDRVLARANPGGRRRPALLSEPSAGR
jgi:D-beta-D-heptose 7-phosphate kinase/D-beta-D-heptose 1-phosphate adenosyltransferase